jgi:dihydroorotate dehydrogenase
MIAAADRMYRLLYGSVLSRLPESTAVALGQAGLRILALDRLPMFRSPDTRLAVTLGGVRLPNPLILSSMYYELTILRRAMGLGFGAVTTKSITRHPRPGHPEPTLVRTRSAAGPGLANCNGFKNPGLDAYVAALAALPHRVPLIVSVAGESVDEYVTLVERLSRRGELVEINISSPNTALVYEWSRKPAELRGLFERVRAATGKPLIVKVSPDFAEANLTTIIPAALESGVRIVNYGNTRRIEDPRLSQGAGGLSGPDLFPMTLANLERTRAAFGDAVEIVATGGVDSPAKARALIAAGAAACGYFTGFITRGPTLARIILDHLSEELDRSRASGLRDLRNR